MQLKGLEGLLQFLSILREKGVYHRIEQQRDDSIEVALDMVGVRCEVSFFVDHIEYSVFRGHEDVETDPESLLKLIEDNA